MTSEASISVSHEQFSCAICLELLRDPATLSCGHCFCLTCIRDYWDQGPSKGPWSCPQCRQAFDPRPALGRNGMLAEVIEKVKEKSLKSGPGRAGAGIAGPAGVECDFCTGRVKRPAVKSCLNCLGSYCDIHVQPHRDVPCLIKHRLVAAKAHLQAWTCAQHEGLVEAYCRTDERLICLVCVMEDHSGHNTVSAAAERSDKQRALLEMKGETQRRLQAREKEQQDLRQALKTVKASAQAALVDSDRMFSELVGFIERKRSEVKALIRACEAAEVSRAQALLDQVEQEVAELRSRQTDMETLLQTDDHVEFLQRYQAQSVSEGHARITFVPEVSFRCMMESVSMMKEKAEHVFQDRLNTNPHRAVRVGDRVRVKVSVSQPKYGWGVPRVKRTSVGVVRAVDPSGQQVKVDFPEHANWTALLEEMELAP